jgi:hypothetical protein
MFQKKLNYISAKLRKKYPLIMPYIIANIKALNFKRFENERKLVNGNDITNSTKTSIIFFTAHKCVSSYIKRIIKLLAEDYRMIHIDFESYFKNLKKNNWEKFSDKIFLEAVFKKQGYYYGSFKTYRNIPNLEEYKIVLMLRDPRDILVSQYLSISSKNSLYFRGVNKIQQRNTFISIDDYVLESAKILKTIYETYCSKFIGKDNVLFFKYEDMLSNYDHWIEKLSKHIKLDVNHKLIQSIKHNDNFNINLEKEYIYKTILNPGEYKDNLKKSTIQKLNEIFAKVDSKLDYNKLHLF